MAIYEIALLARATWNLHSLNNEGTVGNVTEPRTVVLANGEKTDGISGEMLKHIHAYNMWLLEEDKSKFCDACKVLQPQKADKVASSWKLTGDRAQKVKDSIKKAIQGCVLCDVHGFLITKVSAPRSSTVEFGWALGLPQIHRDMHVHTRFSPEEIQETSEETKGKKPRAAQAIYHRPSRSGVYAIVSLLQPWRIGLNEIDFSYSIDDSKRKERYQLALNAYKASLMRTDGAMTSTRLPHIESINGLLVISENNFPVPVVSPLNNDYINQIEELISTQKGFTAKKFNNMAQLCSIIDEIFSENVYKLNMS